ncbi:MAG: aspartate--tRNA ligase [Bacteroidales bacterium]
MNYRTHRCGDLRIKDIGKQVILSGWVRKARNLGGMTFIDLCDRYGITQLVFDIQKDQALCSKARKLGREFVIKAEGKVHERSNKNPDLPTGDIEIIVSRLTILNESKTPPFTIEDKTDGGEELRMKYRYLDLRRNINQRNLKLRHRLALEVRNYLSAHDFMEIETPYLIKSTPEGARDFVVPSRMHEGQFYALPQSPQTFKQLLMISGYDRYFQVVRCFRDEDFRADRQPEFTQIDCEMAFADREEIFEICEGLTRHLFQKIQNIELPREIPRMSWDKAIENYGTDKPDIRFDMRFVELNDVAKNQGFKVFDSVELVVGIKAEGCAGYSRKQLDQLTKFVQRPQIGAKGLVYVKYNDDGSFKSSVDKFFDQKALAAWADKFHARPGDLMLILAGDSMQVRKQLSELRLEMGNQLGLTKRDTFAPLWVVDFPLLEWDEEHKRYHAMHHPFTAPLESDNQFLEKSPEKARANAYDLVINGVEIGGGSIRIFDRKTQSKMFKALGFSEQEAKEQFGFLLNAFEYGAPPHGGIAFGFDRIVALLGGTDSIRDYIAFPKNNAGRDIMIDAPACISNKQLKELSLTIDDSAMKK